MSMVWPCPLAVDAYALMGGAVKVPRSVCPSCSSSIVSARVTGSYVRWRGRWEVVGLQLMDAAVCARTHNPELAGQLREQAQIVFGSEACLAILELGNARQLPAPGSPGFEEFIDLAAAGDVEIATVVLVRNHQWLPSAATANGSPTTARPGKIPARNPARSSSPHRSPSKTRSP